MAVDQLPRLTGVRTSRTEFFPQIWSFLGDLTRARPATVMLSIAVLAFLFVLARFFPALPGPLLAVALATAAVVVLDLDGRNGVAVIGPVPSGLPDVALPDLDALPHLMLPAIGVLLVAYTDFILTSRAFADRTDKSTALDANQEFLALGTANLGAGPVNGFPATAAPAVRPWRLPPAPAARRTHCSRGQSSWPFCLPQPLADPDAFGRTRRARHLRGGAHGRRPGLLQACVVPAPRVVPGTRLPGRCVASWTSCTGCSWPSTLGGRVADPRRTAARRDRGLVPGMAGMHDVDDYPQARTIPGLVVYRYDSPLFFANAEDFRRRALTAVTEQTDPVRWFVLNTEANVEVDITALDAVDDLRQDLTDRGIVFALAGSSRTCWTSCRRTASRTPSAPTASSRHCPPPGRVPGLVPRPMTVRSGTPMAGRPVRARRTSPGAAEYPPGVAGPLGLGRVRVALPRECLPLAA